MVDTPFKGMLKTMGLIFQQGWGRRGGRRGEEEDQRRRREDILQFKGLFFSKVKEICIQSEVKDHIP